MKLVASRDFFNSPQFNLPRPAGDAWKNALAVPKGYAFDFGKSADGTSYADSFDGIANDGEKDIALKLIAFAGCVVDDGSKRSKDMIKRINDEVAAEKKAAANVKEPVDVVTAVTNGILAGLKPLLEALTAKTAKG